MRSQLNAGEISLRGCLYEVRHLTYVGRLTCVGYFSSCVYMRKVSNLSEMLYIAVNQHA